MSQPTPTPPPRVITIKPYPITSTTATDLSTALDNELAAMYPDWNDLPHPGFQVGFVGGDSLLLHTPNNPTSPRSDPDSVNNPTTESTNPHQEQGQGIYFFLAFDETDHHPSQAPTPEQAVGCIALKPLPYFPHHRRPTQIYTRPTQYGYHYAEIKRLYIAPSHRGVRVCTDSESKSTTRLVTLLVDTAVSTARRLGVDRLVLETGTRQLAAIRVYERLGWRRRSEYGDYVGAGVGDGGVSVCYEFDLG